MLRNLNEQDFETLVKQSDKPVVVKFTAEWWPACKQLGPVVSKVSEDLEGKISFFSLDVDESPNLPRQFGVMSIPTMILFKNGTEVDRVIGFVPKDAVVDFASQ